MEVVSIWFLQFILRIVYWIFIADATTTVASLGFVRYMNAYVGSLRYSV